jgi:hypothetical protein
MRSAPDIATCLYYTGIDPFTKKEVHVAKGINDRKMQRALMQFFKPPANPPKEALEARRRAANRAVNGGDDDDHYHTVANPAKSEKPGERGASSPKPTGYRPGRKSQKRRKKR